MIAICLFLFFATEEHTKIHKIICPYISAVSSMAGTLLSPLSRFSLSDFSFSLVFGGTATVPLGGAQPGRYAYMHVITSIVNSQYHYVVFPIIMANRPISDSLKNRPFSIMGSVDNISH